MAQYSTLSAATTESAEASGLSRAFQSLMTFSRRHPLSAFWGLVAAAIVAVTVLAPAIVPFDPLKANFRRMTKPPSIEAQSYFGTDQIGRDTLSRVIYGGRSSLLVAVLAVVLGTTTGSLWGLASGYIGRAFRHHKSAYY
ncbi:MAG: hypothetical protein ETSY1_23965 [Candidatus Entotheonella factor]|uniref:Oligopeptide transport permease C-like N-terminal domain-containing protein n=1 Tax=Entotheonella factor TaxID=1429438 RepID=W4LG80_ENTF1|nr:MAG: hypothetical protein ETSY1_23965 [Candidatus Entotheonella factor]